MPYDLMVFDNGSGPETVTALHELKEAGDIQILVLSESNLGKGGAWNFIFGAAPGEILAYSDSDALFYPGWLKRSVELLEAFPNVGMVTARPFRTSPDLYSSTIRWAEQDNQAVLERGSFVGWQDFLNFDRSLGQPEQEIRERYEATEDVRVRYNGTTAMVGASHFQFVANRSVVRKFLPFDMNQPMGQVIELDQKMNEGGYLRLMTEDPLVMNMSNTPIVTDSELPGAPAKSGIAITKRILEFKPVRWILLGVYNRIFRWYYHV